MAESKPTIVGAKTTHFLTLLALFMPCRVNDLQAESENIQIQEGWGILVYKMYCACQFIKTQQRNFRYGRVRKHLNGQR